MRAMNLILPILEIEALGEAFRLAAALCRAALSAPRRRASGDEGRRTGGSNYHTVAVNEEIMVPETLYAVREGVRLGLMMVVHAVALIIGLAALVGFAIYLISVPWLCFLETRRPARRRMRPTPSGPEPPEPDEYDLLLALACLDAGMAGGAAKRDRRSTSSRTSSAAVGRGAFIHANPEEEE
jgi:hypothetical protein